MQDAVNRASTTLEFYVWSKENMSEHHVETPLFPRTMIDFEQHGVRFNLRVCVVALHDGKVLAEYAPVQDFWFLMGGRAELWEEARETLRREVQEELGVSPISERLLFLIENFLVDENETYQHELGLYFLIDFPKDCYLYQQDEMFEREEEGFTHYYRWQPLEALAELPLYPRVLCQELLNLPEHPKHIVNIDQGVVLRQD
jgi:8-oxo-dGTP pyrophosphatase MutT (NUDIX family)